MAHIDAWVDFIIISSSLSPYTRHFTGREIVGECKIRINCKCGHEILLLPLVIEYAIELGSRRHTDLAGAQNPRTVVIESFA